MVRFNVLAMSGRAVEAAGDVQTLILDKTGTITMGNRQATRLIPLSGCTEKRLAHAASVASHCDTTPEGRTVVTFARQRYADDEPLVEGAHGLDFSAATCMSGTDLPDGQKIRKGVGTMGRFSSSLVNRNALPATFFSN
jgi:K+-transporting ATPase ATPase B chain